ncbi:MAG: hypothetical protein K1X31_13100 [Gemmatimonadaceae bacterium]|nr:hypothetical protein [Gemmatimonadaceae bacterium]
MSLEARVESVDEAAVPPVEYAWDPDTEILRAAMRPAVAAPDAEAAVDLEGRDGAWLTLELTAGALAAVEVAVWPDVRSCETLVPPSAAPARLLLADRDGRPGAPPVEVDTAIGAVADRAERTIHFRIGPPRPCRAVRVARELLVELDGRSRLAGLWLLNVPPFPSAR